MNYAEVVVGHDYQVKPPKRNENPRDRRYTGRAIALAKREGMDRKSAEHKRYKTRTVHTALEYKGYPTNTVVRNQRVWDESADNGYGGMGNYVYRDVPIEVPDYEAGIQILWEYVEYPVNRYVKLWDEYLEEQEIEEEMRLQREEAREEERRIRQEQQDKERKERLEVAQLRIDGVKEWLDQVFPEHGIEFNIRTYSDRIDMVGDFNNIEWWEKLVESSRTKA